MLKLLGKTGLKPHMEVKLLKFPVSIQVIVPNHWVDRDGKGKVS